MGQDKPTPGALEAVRRLAEEDGIYDVPQTCDPSFKAGQIAGLEWAAKNICAECDAPTGSFLAHAAECGFMRREIARLKGEGGE